MIDLIRRGSPAPLSSKKKSVKNGIHAERVAKRYVAQAKARGKPSAEVFFLEDLLERVMSDSFDPKSTRLLIEYFNARLIDPTAMPLSGDELRVLLDFIGFAFARICAGKSADAAFGLRRRKGKPSSTPESRNLEMAAAVVRLRRAGVKFQLAIDNVATCFLADGADDSLVRKAFTRYKKQLSQLSNAEIAGLLGLPVDDAEGPKITPFTRYKKQPPQLSNAEIAGLLGLSVDDAEGPKITPFK